MNIDSGYPVSHNVLLVGSGERAAVTLSRVAGYRRSHRGTNDAQLFAQSRTLRIRLKLGLDFSNVGSISPLRWAVAILPWTNFHELSRAGGPKGLKREHPPGTERKSLTKECGWKDGDRGGLAEWETDSQKGKAKPVP